MADNSTRRMAPADVLKDIGIWGIAALGLFGPIVGLRTISDTTSNRTILDPRWLMLAIFIACVMAIRAYVLLKPKRETGRAPSAVSVSIGNLASGVGATAFAWIGVGLVIAFPIVMLYWKGPAGSLKWIDSYGIMILIYVMLGWGLNVVVGLAGLLDLGYVAFYAVGAYAYALLGTHFGLSFWILLPAAGCMAAFWGVMLGFPVLRLRGDYLAIVTLAFGEIIRLVLINWREVTNGSAGISGIPKVTFFGLMSFNVSDPNYIAKVLGIAQSGAYYKIFLYYLIVLLCLLTAFVTVRLRRLPIGRAWEALREDEIACKSRGINTTTTKLTAFATGAMFGGFAGAFFATRQGFISPESFTFHESCLLYTSPSPRDS